MSALAAPDPVLLGGDGMSARSPLDDDDARYRHGDEARAKYAEERRRADDGHVTGQVDPPTQIVRQVGADFKPDKWHKRSFCTRYNA